MNKQLDLVKEFLLACQEDYCQKLENLDGKQKFIRDPWQHQTGGGGITRVLSQGSIFEQAGVNFSHVYGDKLPAAATQTRPHLAGQPFNAMGISVVIHPFNPFIPTTHANVRFFQSGDIFWFGGGFDLTPYYPFEEDCIYWHQEALAACKEFGDDVYPRYKKWCDEYFYLKHRNEQRGIGGLFFDDLYEWGFDKSFAFMQSVAKYFMQAYLNIASKRINTAYSEPQRQFQLYRRGRYVEFNLLYDRGTLFGLQSGGRTESILMSLPPIVNWSYNFQAEPNSAEADLLNFLKPREWLS